MASPAVRILEHQHMVQRSQSIHYSARTCRERRLPRKNGNRIRRLPQAAYAETGRREYFIHKATIDCVADTVVVKADYIFNVDIIYGAHFNPTGHHSSPQWGY